jgi:hypothetical protein
VAFVGAVPVLFALLLLSPLIGPIGVSGATFGLVPPAAPRVDATSGHAGSSEVSVLTSALLHLPPSFLLSSINPVEYLSQKFWGADVRIYAPANSTLAAGFNQTGLTFARWPGGAVADEFNISSNRIYHDNGAYSTPPTSITQFARWCNWVGCRAIIQLPGEINSPEAAAYEVQYIENVVGFHPAYFEIGNEPALWKHFNISWTNWNSTQRSKITPMAYAELVQAYTVAIRAVDPKAQIIGLPGFGEGGYHEPTWIKDTVEVNGPNISGVAIHVYPSGRGPPSSPSLTHFYASLTGSGALGYRVPRDRAAITAGCPNCTGIQLFVTELGAGNGGGSYGAFMKSYDNVPYIASEIMQGIALNLTNIDLFALQGRYSGSLMNSSYQMSDIGKLYKNFFIQLGRGVLAPSNESLESGVRMAILQGSLPGSYALLVVSTNTTNAQTLSLTLSGFPIVGKGQVRSWDSSELRPTVRNYPIAVPLTYTIPALGVLLVESCI